MDGKGTLRLSLVNKQSGKYFYMETPYEFAEKYLNEIFRIQGYSKPDLRKDVGVLTGEEANQLIDQLGWYSHKLENFFRNSDKGNNPFDKNGEYDFLIEKVD
ncbi:MAG: hypothetical protein ACP5E4_04620 [Candidatus Aenigmatarchaeota archaeon]